MGEPVTSDAGPARSREASAPSAAREGTESAQVACVIYAAKSTEDIRGSIGTQITANGR
jgi:hypothetical protein